MTEQAKRYGGSLFELAAEEQLDDRILGELDGAVSCFAENEEYFRLLALPSLSHAIRRGLLDEAFGGQVHPYVVNFLKLLCDEGLLRELPGCAQAYRERYNQAHGIVQVKAASAIPLDEATRARLTEKLKAVTGKQIELTVTVDPTLLGGIRLDMDGMRLDGTVRARLDGIRAGLDSLTL